MEQKQVACRILIIDAYELRRAGLKLLIDSWIAPDARSLTIAPEGLDKVAGEDGIKLVIMSLGGTSVLESSIRTLVSEVRRCFPSSPCIILSDYQDASEAIEAASMGMQAFLSTSMPSAVVRQAMEFIENGGSCFPREAILAASRERDRLGVAASHADGGPSGMTRRQQDVLERLRRGLSNKLIARELHMQEATVKVHVRQIMRKLGATNRTQAALLAASKSPAPIVAAKIYGAREEAPTSGAVDAVLAPTYNGVTPGAYSRVPC